MSISLFLGQVIGIYLFLTSLALLTNQKTYKKFGIDVFEDCLNINAVNCRPMDKAGDNREPTPHEIACCRSRVWQIIEEKKPKIIIALGSSVITSLLGHRWKKNLGGITKWRGWRIPDRDMKGWLCLTFHPSYINRLQTDEANTIWQQDLSAAFSMLKKPYPIQEDDTKCVLGIGECDGNNKCALHDQWIEPRDLIRKMYKDTTLDKLEGQDFKM
jgi:uracil-DNA glycosylase family 4